MEELFGDQ